MDLPSQTGRAPSSSLEPGASKAQSHLWCQGWSRQPPWHKGERGGAGPPADLSDMLCLFSSIQSIPLRARGRVRPPLAFARVWEGLGTMPAAWRNAGGRSSRLARLEWTQTPPRALRMCRAAGPSRPPSGPPRTMPATWAIVHSYSRQHAESLLGTSMFWGQPLFFSCIFIREMEYVLVLFFFFFLISQTQKP